MSDDLLLSNSMPWLMGEQRRPTRWSWQHSSTGRVLLLEQDGLVAYNTAKLLGLALGRVGSRALASSCAVALVAITPARLPRVAGQHIEPGTIVPFVFSTSTSSLTSRAPAGVHARKAAALRLIHLKTAHRAR